MANDVWLVRKMKAVSAEARLLTIGHDRELSGEGKTSGLDPTPTGAQAEGTRLFHPSRFPPAYMHKFYLQVVGPFKGGTLARLRELTKINNKLTKLPFETLRRVQHCLIPISHILLPPFLFPHSFTPAFSSPLLSSPTVLLICCSTLICHAGIDVRGKTQT